MICAIATFVKIMMETVMLSSVMAIGIQFCNETNLVDATIAGLVFGASCEVLFILIGVAKEIIRYCRKGRA